MKKRIVPSAVAMALLAVSAVGCDGNKKTEDSAATEEVPAIDTLAMDRTVSPRENFFLYANGGWMKAHPLTPEYSRFGAFDELSLKSEVAAHEIIESLKDAAEGTDEAKAYLLYALSTDSAKLESDGAKPILADLAEIDALADKDALVDYMAKSDNQGGGSFFNTFVAADEKSSDVNILNLYQAGLVMGVPDYYSDEAAYKGNQEAYRTYFTRVFDLVGMKEASAQADRLFGLEKDLSKILYTMVELRDSQRNYNKMSLEDFYAQHTFPWKRYIDGREGYESVKELNVAQKDYFDRFDKWFAATSLEDLKLFLKGQLIDGASDLLSNDFREAAFALHGKSIAGKEEMKPLWKLGVNRVDNCLGDVIGKQYVAKYFPPEAKERMTELVNNLVSALSSRIDNLSWMTAATKEKAQEKLGAFTVKIGYPDKWLTFEKLNTTNESLYAYSKEVGTFLTRRNTADLKKPVDRNRWLMNAHQVNAYYNPTTNEICFPAGILQPPFFNLNADDAVNYGAIGVVIGHEMTHGFDDQGCNYDAKGNMENWWTEEDRKTFDAATQKLAAQFDRVEVAPGLMANGQMTLGENIADQGGLLVAYDAMVKATEGKEYPEIDGLSRDQRFYLGYARVWGQNIRPEEIIRRTKTDVHSLGKFRVNQTLKNIDTFYTAFGVQEGDSMYIAPEERVEIW